MTFRLRLELQLGHRPANSTGQLGAGDGTGQLPGSAQLGHNQLAVSQQRQAAMVMLMFIEVGWGLAPVWGGPSRGHRDAATLDASRCPFGIDQQHLGRV